jgi:hypothetical protein
MEQPDEESVNEIFDSILRSVLPSRLITNFIIVAEVADDDTSELTVSVSNGLTPWMADGMLRYAQQMVMMGDFTSQEEQNEE